MAIKTNGRLHNVLQTYAPNAKVEIVSNGEHRGVGAIRFYKKEMRVEIITEAMSDEELLEEEPLDDDDDEEEGDDDED